MILTSTTTGTDHNYEVWTRTNYKEEYELSHAKQAAIQDLIIHFRELISYTFEDLFLLLVPRPFMASSEAISIGGS